MKKGSPLGPAALPPLRRKGGAGSGLAKPVPRRLLGVELGGNAGVEIGFTRATSDAGDEEGRRQRPG